MNTNRPLAMVTGGSSGIGFELAKQFAHNAPEPVKAARHAKLTRLQG